MKSWIQIGVMLTVWASAPEAFAGNAGVPEVNYPVLPATATSAQHFVPDEWRLERHHRGDLNTDERDDLVMVLRMGSASNFLRGDLQDEQEIDTNPRMLVVAFAEDGGYWLAFEDHALIPRPENPEMDDYLDGEDAVQVRRGAFSVRLHAWSSAGGWSTSNTTFTFRHQDGCFKLIGYDNTEVHRGSGEIGEVSINYATGKAIFGRGSIESDAPLATQSIAVSKRQSPCLQTIGNGFDFDPGVEPPRGS